MTESGPTVGNTASISPELEPGQMTLRQTADVLGVSSTTLRKMIRRGLLPEAEKVKTFEGRVWAIPIDAVPGIA
ncbi:MAG: helix-turn-helix domain-containing protein, partial [Acidimicrobiales bacterium]|nr:helix-turn-helix domain-containing protein [Acidimicrobiales bacterium]